MAIPKFNKRGVLDKGIHKCTSEEFINKFCYGKDTIRSKYKEILEQLFAFTLSRNGKSIIIGGSFITDKIEPNDLDCMVIVPNKSCCTIQNNELLCMEECELDILVVSETRKDLVYSLLNMFSLDRYNIDVGMIEVILDEELDKSTWDDYGSYYSFESLLVAREAYINRHVIRGITKKKILVTVCNLNEYLYWNYEIAPIISSAGWIFAPYVYSCKKISEELEFFKLWLTDIYHTYETEICVFADGLGTYLLGRYLKDDSKYGKASFDKIILSKTLLTKTYDWSKEIDRLKVNLILNLKDKSGRKIINEYVPKTAEKDVLFGDAYRTGFNDRNKRVIEYNFDYSHDIDSDEFKKSILPMYHMSSILEDNIEKLCLENIQELMEQEVKLSEVTLQKGK